MRNKNGFTLVELLVTISMLAVIGTIIIYNTIGLTNNTKELQYERMVENIENATKTYISLHPEEFSDLYSTRAYTYIQLQTVINSGLLDDGLENPYTKEKINGSEEIKVYIDGDSGELVYKYPVTDADRNNEIWLQTVTKTVQVEYKYGYRALINLYEGIGTSELGLVNENGIIINDYSAQGYNNNREYYKKYYNMKVTAPGLETCSQVGGTTEFMCGLLGKIDVGDIWYNGADDYFLAPKAGNYYIEYQWTIPGDKPQTRTKKRLIRVIDNTSNAEKEKEQGETPQTPSTPSSGSTETTDEDKVMYDLAEHVSNKDYYYANGRPIINGDHIRTNLKLMEKDRSYTIIMTASANTYGNETKSTQFFHAMKEIKPYSGITLRDNYSANEIGLCSDLACERLPYTVRVPWKIIVYRDIKYPNVVFYTYCSNYSLEEKRCATTPTESYTRYVYEYYNRDLIIGAFLDNDNNIGRQMDGTVYDFRVIYGTNTAKTETEAMKKVQISIGT